MNSILIQAYALWMFEEYRSAFLKTHAPSERRLRSIIHWKKTNCSPSPLISTVKNTVYKVMEWTGVPESYACSPSYLCYEFAGCVTISSAYPPPPRIPNAIASFSISWDKCDNFSSSSTSCSPIFYLAYDLHPSATISFSSARIWAVWGWSPSTTTKRMHLRLFRCDLAVSSHLFYFSAIERSQLRTDIPACKPQHRCLSSASTYPAAFPGSTCATLEKPQGIPRIRFVMHSPISTSTRPYCIMQAILLETLQAISMLPHLAHISTRQLIPPQTHPDSKPLWMICLWTWLSPSTARKLVHALSIGTKVHLSRNSGILVPFARKLHRFLRSLMRNCTVPGGAIVATSASTHGGFLESPCWRVPPVSFFCSKSGYFAFLLQSADLPWIPESFCGPHYPRNVEESYGNFNKTTVTREKIPFSFSYSDPWSNYCEGAEN